MKKLLLALAFAFGVSSVSHAVFTPTIISTDVLQSGTTFYVSSGTVTQLQVSTITNVTSINGSFPNPNILINGGFEFWQRGSSTTAAADGVYITDRWEIETNEATNVTISTDTTVLDSGVYSAKVVITAAGASKYWRLRQSVENYQEYRGKTVSLSVRVNANTASAVRVMIRDSTSVTYSSFHTGGGTWETLVATRTIDAATTFLSIYVGGYDVGDKKNGTYYYDSAMLVVGNKPIDFIPDNYQSELAKAQRYLYRINNPAASERTLFMGQAIDAGTSYGALSFPVTMRTSPTMTSAGTFGSWSASGTPGSCTPSSVAMMPQVAYLSCNAAGKVAGNASLVVFSSLNAYLQFDAEIP